VYGSKEIIVQNSQENRPYCINIEVNKAPMKNSKLNTKIPIAINFFEVSSLQHFSQRALLTANLQPVFDPLHRAGQGLHSYIPYLSDLVKNVLTISV